MLKFILIGCLLLIIACGGAKHSPVEDLSHHQDLSLFKLQSARGTRDGDRLSTQMMFSDTSSILTVEMQFAVGSPTTLQSGTWRWNRNSRLLSGTVTARSVTFLGGQDGPPSIGGAFDLLDPGGTPLYRVSIPVTELKARL
ncbi:MAG TPA: hypothetical protein VEU96_06170 [Bryobacteraceae bacterium]|nr:hypothetical protein [Bryobacteraceae bacterium]